VVLALVIAGALGFAGWFTHAPAAERSARAFDPDRLADLELGMWQAYYAHRQAQLFRYLVVALREQFRYSWSTSLRAAYHLASAAVAFAGRNAPPYQKTLDHLTAAFTIARDWSGAGFRPADVAADELGWWVARRDPATRNPAAIGRLIAVTYAHFYDVPESQVLEAGVLRAIAADLRDRSGAAADWDEIRRVLRASYRSLHAGVRDRRRPG
jgi:hypothetical protein